MMNDALVLLIALGWAAAILALAWALGNRAARASLEAELKLQQRLSENYLKGWQSANNTADAVLRELRSLSALREDAVLAVHEVTALLSSAMHQACHPVSESELNPVPGQPTGTAWLDTMAVSTWRDIGEWLVEHAGWTRHPSGAGRRQFYRPPETDPARLKFHPEDTGE